MPDQNKNGINSIQWKLAIIYKVRLAACATSHTAMGEGLVGGADGWDASLGLKSTIVQVVCTAAPKIIWDTRFLNSSTLNSQSLGRLIDGNNWCGFSAASKTTTALLKPRLNLIAQLNSTNKRLYSVDARVTSVNMPSQSLKVAKYHRFRYKFQSQGISFNIWGKIIQYSSWTCHCYQKDFKFLEPRWQNFLTWKAFIIWNSLPNLESQIFTTNPVSSKSNLSKIADLEEPE